MPSRTATGCTACRAPDQSRGARLQALAPLSRRQAQLNERRIKAFLAQSGAGSASGDATLNAGDFAAESAQVSNCLVSQLFGLLISCLFPAWPWPEALLTLVARAQTVVELSWRGRSSAGDSAAQVQMAAAAGAQDSGWSLGKPSKKAQSLWDEVWATG
jgi:hypothetical protein